MTEPSGIAAPLAAALAKKGYETLTPVQEAVLDPELALEDLLVSAQTGSGKTVAFGLALAPTLLEGNDRFSSTGAPLALIIAPTRELAQQVTKELQWLYREAGGKVLTCVGGMDPREERRALDRGAHIVVGTPGRLSDHLRRGNLDLSEIRSVVLDEADEMLDMGFREELEHILGEAPETRRTLMFSATVSKPIARLAENFQSGAVRVNTVSQKDQHADIEYRALTVHPSDSENAVMNILRFYEAQNAIVFVSRRDAVNRLTSKLNNRGFSVVALSGEYSQKERTNALQAMRDGRARVCVATDVAARGIDLPGLDLVIHAELPRNKEGLLHRSGRTGRAGRKGVCALIVPFRAKRRTERLLQDAKVSASWANPPSAAEVEAADDARLLSHETLSDPVRDGEKALASALLAKFGADQLAAAFIRSQRQGRSAPEDLQAVPADDGKRERKPRERHDRFGSDEGERRPRPIRADFDDGTWVTLSVGRKTNADPKWLLPMLCKSGGFKRDQIGSIQIGTTLTHVELKPDAASTLLDKAGPGGRIDKSITVNRASGPPSGDIAPRPQRKPFKGKPSVKGKKPRWSKDDARRKSGGWTPDPVGKKKPRKPRAEKAGQTHSEKAQSSARIIKKSKKPKS
ncbi:MAG: DEAD/DEAH box helicase [Pseudomonadota bacterium]